MSLAVALLAGCSSGNSAPSAPVQQSIVDPSSHSPRTLLTPANVKPALHKTYSHPMSPNCCAATTKLLFASDGEGGSGFNGAVQVFNYANGSYVGALAAPPEGWFQPQGECVDKLGHVFITNTNMSTIDEYKHNGTFVRALADPDEYPVGCAYDRSTGNLAVSNLITKEGKAGSVAIYIKAKGNPTLYTDPNIYSVYFLGYAGNSGTLYLDGFSFGSSVEYDSFSGGTFTNVPISGGSIGFPGMVAWSSTNKTMNVGDQTISATPKLYHVSSTGQITGATVTQCGQPSGYCAIVQGFIERHRFIGPDPGDFTVDTFAYPAGGAALRGISGYFNYPLGSAVTPDE
ncbi:MAG TPA: hypothetical protein VGI19_03470 [Candidatus Cybelea sp.]